MKGCESLVNVKTKARFYVFSSAVAGTDGLTSSCWRDVIPLQHGIVPDIIQTYWSAVQALDSEAGLVTSAEILVELSLTTQMGTAC